jgi:hypothetical protein
MSVALSVFEQLTEAGEDRTRARVIAEAFERLEERYPQLKDVATQPQVRETELRLQKDIETIRLEIKEVEAKLTREIQAVRLELTREIETVRLEIKEVEAKLTKDIREVEARLSRDIEQSRRETREMEVRLTQAIHRQTLWVIGAVGAVVGLIRLLEWFLAHLPSA